MITKSPLPYPELFRTFVRRSALRIAQRLEQGYNIDTEGPQLLHTLQFALRTHETWALSLDIVFAVHDDFERMGQYSDWIQILELAIQEGHTYGTPVILAKLRVHSGPLYLIQGQHAKAFTVLQESLSYLTAPEETLWQGRALIALAQVYQHSGQPDDARAMAHRALQILPEDALHEQARAYRVLGTIAFEHQQWDIAQQAFEQSLTLWRAGGDARHIGFGLVNLGSVLRANADEAGAIQVYQEAMDLFASSEDRVNYAAAQMNLGNVYLGQQHYAMAKMMYHAAEGVFRNIYDVPRLARLYNNWGMALAEEHEWESAIVCFRQSLTYWHTIGQVRGTVNTMDNLGLALVATGQRDAGIGVYRDALALLEMNPLPFYTQLIQEHLHSALTITP